MSRILFFTALLTCFMQPALARTPEIAGKWEHRFKDDGEGDILVLRFEQGALKGEYLGLERENGERTFYSATELQDVELSDREISFTVPVRALFAERPASIAQLRVKAKEWVGGSKGELRFHGRLVNNRFYMECISRSGECPSGEMVFRRRANSEQ